MATAFSKDISSGLSDKQDNFFEATALANAGAITSSYFRLGKNQSRTELAVVFNNAITVAAANSLKVELFYGSTEDGTGWSASDVVVIRDYVDETIAAGTELLYTPATDVEHYGKVVITTTEDHSAKTVTGKFYHTA